jgi:hypothetical protein
VPPTTTTDAGQAKAPWSLSKWFNFFLLLCSIVLFTPWPILAFHSGGLWRVSGTFGVIRSSFSLETSTWMALFFNWQSVGYFVGTLTFGAKRNANTRYSTFVKQKTNVQYIIVYVHPSATIGLHT